MVNVLVVDSDRTFRTLLATRLESDSEIVCHQAADAQLAVDVLDDKDAIDIVIADLQLAKHNAFTLLQHLQSYSDWQGIPVILLSNVTADRINIPSADWQLYGVNGYLQKSTFDVDDLIARVKGVRHPAPAA